MGHLPLILTYLKQVQQHNIAAVNEAINELYVESEQHEELRQSIEDFEQFDQIALAQKLEKHELVEMRRVASLVWKKNKRYKQAIELSKKDYMFKDIIDSAKESGSAELAATVLKFFVEEKLPDC